MTMLELSLHTHSNVDKDAVQIGELYRKARASVKESIEYLVDAFAPRTNTTPTDIIPTCTPRAPPPPAHSRAPLAAAPI